MARTERMEQFCCYGLERTEGFYIACWIDVVSARHQRKLSVPVMQQILFDFCFTPHSQRRLGFGRGASGTIFDR